MNTGNDIFELAQKLVKTLSAQGLTIITAESCTGGLIASAITEISGSSDVFYGGFVSYANEAKANMLGVDTNLINTHGAVSPQVASAMAQGALANSKADVSVSVTGIAGPTGGTADKPVGLVYIAVASNKEVSVQKHSFGNIGREGIRAKTVEKALSQVIQTIIK